MINANTITRNICSQFSLQFFYVLCMKIGFWINKIFRMIDLYGYNYDLLMNCYVCHLSVCIIKFWAIYWRISDIRTSVLQSVWHRQNKYILSTTFNTIYYPLTSNNPFSVILSLFYFTPRQVQLRFLHQFIFVYYGSIIEVPMKVTIKITENYYKELI